MRQEGAQRGSQRQRGTAARDPDLKRANGPPLLRGELRVALEEELGMRFAIEPEKSGPEQRRCAKGLVVDALADDLLAFARGVSTRTTHAPAPEKTAPSIATLRSLLQASERELLSLMLRLPKTFSARTQSGTSRRVLGVGAAAAIMVADCGCESRLSSAQTVGCGLTGYQLAKPPRPIL